MATHMVFFDDAKLNHRYRNNCSVKARVIKTWLQPGYGEKQHLHSLEVLMVDEHGNKMQASASNFSKAKFESILVDDAVVIISNYSFGLNNSKYKLTENPHKLTLTMKTTVKVVDNFDGPLYGFKFESFSNITTQKVVIGEPVDVIGCVVGYGDPQPFGPQKEQNFLINTTLMNTEQDQIDCTLFGVYAEQFLTFIASHDMEEPIIITLQFARTKIWNDHPIVQNDYYGTRLLINASIDEVVEFKQRMVDTNFVLPVLNKIPPKPSTISIEDYFLGDIKRQPLAEIDNQKKVDVYTSLSTIEGLLDEDDWSYIACKKCTRRVTPIDENQKIVGSIDQKLAIPFKCKKCGKNPSVYLRFKVNFMVGDETGSSAFTLFEKDVIELVSSTAYDLKKRQAVDDDSVPDELDALIGQRFLWRITVSEYNLDNTYKIYTVNKFTKNEDIIKKWCHKHGVEQDIDLIDDSQTSNSDKIISTEDSVTEDNEVTLDFTTPTTNSSQRKRHGDDLNLEPASVEPTSKKRCLLKLNDNDSP